MTENRLVHRFEYDPRDATAACYGYGRSLSPGDRDIEGRARQYGYYRGWDSFISKVFNRPSEPGENPFPTHASLRAEPAFRHGLFFVVPLEYLADVVLPDFTIREIGIKNRWRVSTRIPVALPVAGAPVLTRDAAAMLAAARERELFEVPVKVRYV